MTNYVPTCLHVWSNKFKMYPQNSSPSPWNHRTILTWPRSNPEMLVFIPSTLKFMKYVVSVCVYAAHNSQYVQCAVSCWLMCGFWKWTRRLFLILCLLFFLFLCGQLNKLWTSFGVSFITFFLGFVGFFLLKWFQWLLLF